jgi:hypothetical protein
MKLDPHDVLWAIIIGVGVGLVWSVIILAMLSAIGITLGVPWYVIFLGITIITTAFLLFIWNIPEEIPIKQPSMTCSNCHRKIVPGLKNQIDDLSITSRDNKGNLYGGYCHSCNNYFCWDCLEKYAKSMFKTTLLQTNTQMVMATLESDGTLHCPNCGGIGKKRTVMAL